MRSSIGSSALRATATPTETLTAGDAEPAQVERADRGPDALPDLERDLRARVAQQDDELLAAVAGRDVVLADGRHDRPADRAQDLVAGRVAVRVVEHLELVDVDHQDADRVARPAAAGEQAAELVEVAAVRQAGQRVGRGLRLGRPVRVGPRQRRRRLDRGAAEDPAGRRRPGVGGPARQDDRADDAVVRGQRRGQRVGQAVDLPDPAGDPLGDGCPARLAAADAVARRSGTAASRRPATRSPRRDARRRRSSSRPRERRRPRRPARRDVGPTGIGDRLARGRRSAATVGRSTGSSRSPIGRSVVESGTPGPGADERRLEDAGVGPAAGDDDVVGAGRRRPSSSTMAPTIASGETERDRPDRIRANDSASSRRPASSAATAWRWRIAATPTTTTSADDDPVERAAPLGDERGATAIRPRTKNEPAKIHQARRIRRSGGSGGAVGGPVGLAHVGIEDGGPDASASIPRRWYGWSCVARYFRTRSGGAAAVGSGGGVAGRGGVVAAVALDAVQRAVGGGDELGGGPAVGRERRHADRRADRDRPALLADEGVVAERLEDPLGGAARLVARRSRAG